MTLQLLKQTILQKQELPNVSIFVCKKEKFIPQQYIEEIRKSYNIQVQYVSELKNDDTQDIFCVSQYSKNALKVFSTDELSFDDEISEELFPIFIICSKILSNSLTSKYKNDIISIDELEDWQIKDYAYSMAKGAKKSDIDWILNNCKDIYRLSNELQKYSIFKEEERKYLFTSFKEDGLYDDLLSTTEIDFSNYIVYKDTENIMRFYPYVKQKEVDGFAILGIVYNTMRNLIVSHMGRNIIASDYGMSDKQLYFLRTKSLPCDQSSFLNKFLKIGELDKRVKDGEILAQDLIDLIINIMYE